MSKEPGAPPPIYESFFGTIQNNVSTVADLLSRSTIATSLNVLSQRSVNYILQESQNTCLTNCNSNIENVTIVIDNGSRVGNIVIESKCNAQTVCTMKTELATIAAQQLDAYQLAESQNFGRSFQIFPGTRIAQSRNIVFQELENIITQSINNSCETNANSSIQNLTLYVGNNSEVAGYAISSSTTATTNCSMENTAKSEVTQAARSEQTAKSSNVAISFIMMMIVMFSIVAISFVILDNQKRKVEIENEGEIFKAAIANADPKDVPTLLSLKVDSKKLNEQAKVRLTDLQSISKVKVK